jgi:hypothetical protein
VPHEEHGSAPGSGTQERSNERPNQGVQNWDAKQDSQSHGVDECEDSCVEYRAECAEDNSRDECCGELSGEGFQEWLLSISEIEHDSRIHKYSQDQRWQTTGQ